MNKEASNKAMAYKNKADTNRRRTAYIYGLLAEAACALYLILLGHRILHRRFQSRAGEIDLIAKKKKLLIFCEVKFRRSQSEALFSITTNQKHRISAAAGAFIAQNPHFTEFDCRMDVFVVCPWSLPKRIKNAW